MEITGIKLTSSLLKAQSQYLRNNSIDKHRTELCPQEHVYFAWLLLL